MGVLKIHVTLREVKVLALSGEILRFAQNGNRKDCP
jgi:hypothetical protein